MSSEIIFGLYIFALATFVGYQVISRVPALLHTPLMSGTNAISGISLVGSLVAACYPGNRLGLGVLELSPVCSGCRKDKSSAAATRSSAALPVSFPHGD